MLKYKLDKIDDLDEAQQAFYEPKDGAFVLKVDGLPPIEDVTGLKAQRDELLAEKKAEQAKARQEAEKARQAAEDVAKKTGDFEALSRSYEQKIAALDQQLKDKDASISKKEIERQSSLIAAELAEGHNQEILSLFIAKRLRVEGDALKVNDEKGDLTISTIDQLKEEFRGNPKFSSLVIASKASGGGATGGKNSGGAATVMKRSEMTADQRAGFVREHGQDAYLKLPK